MKHVIPMGVHRWLTLTAPGDGDGMELPLEPDAPGGQALENPAGGGRNTLYLLRRGRRQLRQPDPDGPAALSGAGRDS
ncbi:hypothetical protein [Sphingobium ummariense]